MIQKTIVNNALIVKNNNARLSWIDIARSFGILAVVLCHTGFPYLQTYLVGPFEVTVFFFISGFLSYKTEQPALKTFITKKVKTILVPYIFFSTIWIVYDIVFKLVENDFTFTNFLRIVLSYVIQIRMKPIWFLTCLFFSELCVYVYYKYIHSRYSLKIKTTLVLFTFVIGAIYYKYVKIALPFNIDLCLVSVPIMIIGGYIKKTKIMDKLVEFSRFQNFLVGILLMIVALCLNFINVKFGGMEEGADLFTSSFGLYFVFMLSALLSSVSLFIISYSIGSCRILEYIGKNSLTIFAIHSIPIGIFRRIFNYNIVPFTWKMIFIMIIVFFISLIITVFINELFIRTPIKKLLGK